MVPLLLPEYRSFPDAAAEDTVLFRRMLRMPADRSCATTCWTETGIHLITTVAPKFARFESG